MNIKSIRTGITLIKGAQLFKTEYIYPNLQTRCTTSQ